jgi:glycosyltransferase involved in cell wall biosynthesis
MAMPMTGLTLVDVSEVASVDDAFIDLSDLNGVPVQWRRHSAVPKNALERTIKRPKLARYRAAWHLPRMTASVSSFTELFRANVSHLAFSFNFTELPTSAELWYFRSAFAGVDEFVTFTNFEIEVYSDIFHLDASRFRRLSWTQPAPIVADHPTIAVDRPFVAAVGGEGRDFATLLAAARRLPNLQFIIIARPCADLTDTPANVRVYYDVPSAVCWAIASAADLLLVPLKGQDTCCGHITLVSGRQLAIPMITTWSRGTLEYTNDYGGTITVQPGDPDALAEAIDATREDLTNAKARARVDQAITRPLYDRVIWRDYLVDFLSRHKP